MEEFIIEELDSLEEWFKACSYIKAVKLNNHTTINDPEKFFNTHISFVRNNVSNYLYAPYLLRLREFKSKTLENEQV